MGVGCREEKCQYKKSPEDIRMRRNRPLRACNALFSTLGLIALPMLKIKHTLGGYKTPRTFPVNNIDKALEYDFTVVTNWLNHLQNYCGGKFNLEGKQVLELGPGADLGVGLILLTLGASKYSAIDIHPLMADTPDRFYEKMFEEIPRRVNGKNHNIKELKKQLNVIISGKSDLLNYVVSDSFDITGSFKKEKIDLIVSQAAFEHFDDVDQVIYEISKISNKNALLVAEIDLKTHTRWFRDVDPLNIYRYNDSIYDMFRFQGSPNRLRPHDYKRILVRNGWSNISITPLNTLPKEYLNKVTPTLEKKFQNESSQMEIINFIISATRL